MDSIFSVLCKAKLKACFITLLIYWPGPYNLKNRAKGLLSKANFKTMFLVFSFKPPTFWSHKNITLVFSHTNSGFKIYYYVEKLGDKNFKMYHFHVKVSYINKSAWATPEWKQKTLVIE